MDFNALCEARTRLGEHVNVFVPVFKRLWKSLLIVKIQEVRRQYDLEHKFIYFT